MEHILDDEEEAVGIAGMIEVGRSEKEGATMLSITDRLEREPVTLVNLGR